MTEIVMCHAIMRSDMLVKIESFWMERVSKKVWNQLKFGKKSCKIGNEYLSNQSLISFVTNSNQLQNALYN